MLFSNRDRVPRKSLLIYAGLRSGQRSDMGLRLPTGSSNLTRTPDTEFTAISHFSFGEWGSLARVTNLN